MYLSFIVHCNNRTGPSTGAAQCGADGSASRMSDAFCSSLRLYLEHRDLSVFLTFFDRPGETYRLHGTLDFAVHAFTVPSRHPASPAWRSMENRAWTSMENRACIQYVRAWNDAFPNWDTCSNSIVGNRIEYTDTYFKVGASKKHRHIRLVGIDSPVDLR